MDADILPGMERIAAAVVGGVSVYLGYRLFLHIPEHRDSSGEIKLPGGISIHMTRVGPGALLALFGTILVSLSFQYAVTHFTTTTMKTGPDSPTNVTVSSKQPRLDLSPSVYFFNGLLSKERPGWEVEVKQRPANRVQISSPSREIRGNNVMLVFG